MSKRKMVRLADIGEIVTGTTPSTSNLEYYSSKDIPFYKPGDLSDSEVRSLCIAQEFLSTCAKHVIRVLPKGSVLVSCIGIIGKIGIATNTCTCNQQINAIIPDENLVNNRYLAYAIISQKDRIRAIANAPIVPIINKTRFSNIRIPLVPLDMQKSIVEILDTVSELLSLRKQQLAELDSLTKAIFYDMFGDPVINDKGWELKKLSDCCCVNPSKKEIDYFTDDLEVSFISMASVSENGDINTNEIRKYREVKTGFTYFYENDVLFAKITPCMENGKGAIARGLKNHIGFGSTEFHVLRPKKGLSNTEWLYHLTTLPIFRTSAEKNMTGSAGQKRVPASFFDKFRVPLPPFSLQTKFADRITQIQTQKNLVKRAIEETQLLFDSLMSQYFDE